MVSEPVAEALPGQLASFTFETSIAGSYAGKTHLVDALNYRSNFGIFTSPISSSFTNPQPNTVFVSFILEQTFNVTIALYHTLHGDAKKFCGEILAKKEMQRRIIVIFVLNISLKH